MADRENYLELIPGSDIPTEWPEIGLRMLGGRAAVWAYKPETRNGVYLPPSGRIQPDVGVLAHDLDTEHYFLQKGTVVAFRPYRGVWLDHEEGPELRIFGVQEPLDYALLMYWDGEWKPLAPWSVIKPEKIDSVIEGLPVSNEIGSILSTSQTDYKPGDKCVYSFGNGMHIDDLNAVLTKELHAPIV